MDFDINCNYLIEGDNVESLSYLSKFILNKVDVIYIDPPYNTGRNFTYNDSFSRTEWLEFMKERLLLAKSLLSESGVIFISIGDDMQAYLKVLCDDIFNIENYIGTIIRKTKSCSNNIKLGFNMQHEYLLVYAKDKLKVKFQGSLKDNYKYKNPDNDTNGNWKNVDPTAKGDSVSACFPIENPYTHKIDYPTKGRQWCFSYDNYLKFVESGRIKFKTSHKPNERGFYYKTYEKDLKNKYENLDSLFGVSNEYLNQVGTRECNKLDLDFLFPKPVAFIKDILRYMGDKVLVLDFFAGSGTTGQAILELNAEDNGSRQFILCQSSENNICENVTYKRLLLAINNLESDKINFKYLKIENDICKEKTIV